MLASGSFRVNTTYVLDIYFIIFYKQEHAITLRLRVLDVHGQVNVDDYKFLQLVIIELQKPVHFRTHNNRRQFRRLLWDSTVCRDWEWHLVPQIHAILAVN